VNIKKLQTHLARLGFNPGPIDGIRGKMTTDAVEKFQVSLHVVADGVVGPITRSLINNSCK
jgi:peptidoglycan hydrolase-like protein with peptidoglycan-binding domain